jgi:hypothetical protein
LRDAGAGEDAKVVGELLFEVEPETILGEKTADGAC